MEDIKINQAPIQPKAEVEKRETTEIKPKIKKNFPLKKGIFFAAVLLVLLFSPFIAASVKEKFFGAPAGINKNDYYAVFLDNSQVYFGKMISKTRDEIVLTNVYYLQASPDTNIDLNNQRFTLIKLGQELHGPTEEMMINMEHVVFYERLRSDSKVVESIKNQN
jgi:hypothetical protein